MLAAAKSNRPTAQEVTDPRLPGVRDDPKVIRSLISEDRWNEFHSNKRILIVDDNRGTAQRIATALSDLYGHVEFETAPKKALQKLSEAAKSKKPYDAVVVDLLMPGLSGIELLRDLKGKCPAAVINTASLLKPIVADMTISLDDYRSTERVSLYSQHRAVPSPIPAEVPILFNHKFGNSLHDLVNKLDSAMLIRSLSKESATRFLTQFNPDVVVASLPDELVHNFCEEVGNAVLNVGVTMRELISEGRIKDSPWWDGNGERVLSAISTLGRFTFSKARKESSKLTSAELHRAVNLIENIEGPDPTNPRIFTPKGTQEPSMFLKEKVAEWDRIFFATRLAVNDLYRRFSEHFSESVEFQALFRDATDRLFPTLKLSEALLEAAPAIKDPERVVRDLVRKVMVALHKRASDGGILQGSVIHGFYNDRRGYEEPRAKNRADSLNWDNYFEISYGDSLTQPLEKSLEQLAPDFADLQRQKLGFFLLGQDGCRFDLFLKGEERKPRSEALSRNNAIVFSKSEPDTVMNSGLREIRVFRDLGSKVKVTALEKEMRDSALRVPIIKPVLFFRNKTEALVGTVSGGSHGSGYTLLAEYILATDPSKNIVYDGNAHLLAEAIRGTAIRLEYKKGGISVDCDPSDPMASNIRAAITALGIEDSKIKFEVGDFEQF